MKIVKYFPMTIPQFSLSIFLIAGCVSGALSQSTYDSRLISTYKNLNFELTEKRGVKGDDGVVYFVDNARQIVTAYDGFRIKWTVNVLIFCDRPVVGKPEIRVISLERNCLDVIYGKHSYARIHLADGKIDCLGSD